ncbi:hypothetical protein [Streptomyces sp. NPDC048636]|uniref:hypothetical protein n=1 Tax=Streptomyces sp. NPDC048636 TaxID=3155762 RepID=UPI003449611E
MAHTRHGGRKRSAGGRRRPGPGGGRERPARLTARRALRREVPSTVALLADERDFTAMRRYASFPFDDHAHYLRQMEGLLRALAARGVHTAVALFDPDGYAEFCADARLDPDTPASRTRYTAETAAAGGTVTYDGQPIDRLVPRLIGAAEERATLEYATALLSRTGARDDIARAAAERAAAALRGVLGAAGPGVHHLVCSVPAGGTSLVAVVHAEARGERPARAAEPGAHIFRTVLACGIASRGPGGIVLRTSLPGERDRVRGWALHDGWLRPLSEAEVFTAYCTDAETGEPIPPEHGVEYRAGIPLTRPDDTHPDETRPEDTRPDGE